MVCKKLPKAVAALLRAQRRRSQRRVCPLEALALLVKETGSLLPRRVKTVAGKAADIKLFSSGKKRLRQRCAKYRSRRGSVRAIGSRLQQLHRSVQKALAREEACDLGDRRAYTAEGRDLLGADMADIFSQKAHQRGFLRRKIKFLRFRQGKQHLEEGLPRLFVLGRDLIVIRLPQQSIAVTPMSDLQRIQQRRQLALSGDPEGAAREQVAHQLRVIAAFRKGADTVEQIVKRAGCKGNARAHRNGNAVARGRFKQQRRIFSGKIHDSAVICRYALAAPKQIAENMVHLCLNATAADDRKLLSGQWIDL